MRLDWIRSPLQLVVILLLVVYSIELHTTEEKVDVTGNWTTAESIDNTTEDTVPDIFMEEMKETQKLIDELKGKGYIQVCDGTMTSNHMIYCSGDLLAAVNMHRLYRDSKTFVDMPLKEEPEVVYSAFKKTFNTSKLYTIDKNKLKEFVERHFLPPSTDELEECQLQDWQPNPPEIMKIKDSIARQWALELNTIWTKLCRKVKPLHENRHSIIVLPNEFVVPGGRFREFYYWDTYWIIKGLLVCGMTKTVEKILGNFQYLIDKYGFIPNGGRIYYLRRSHPPMFAHMVYEYYKKTGKINKGLVDSIARELYFWKTYRISKVNITVTNRKTKFETTQEVFKYFTPSNVPRPESFYEDIEVAKLVPAEKRKSLYTHLASTAEAGWDFSSRFLEGGKTLEYSITTDVVPLDLNAYVCGNMKVLKILTKALNNTETESVEDIKKSMYAVLFDKTNGIWRDYNVHRRNFSHGFYASLSALLYTECYSPLPEETADQIVKYLKENKLLSYAGGIPTSTVKDSEQQWDYPNNFPSLQHMFVMGLLKSRSKAAQELAKVLIGRISVMRTFQAHQLQGIFADFPEDRSDTNAYEMAHNWVERIYSVYRRSGKMWEKYDISKPFGVAGTGGEYGVQSGYGYTNGAILDLLTKYPDSLWLERSIFEESEVEMKSACVTTASLEFRILAVMVIIAVLYSHSRPNL